MVVPEGGTAARSTLYAWGVRLKSQQSNTLVFPRIPNHPLDNLLILGGSGLVHWFMTTVSTKADHLLRLGQRYAHTGNFYQKITASGASLAVTGLVKDFIAVTSAR